MIYNLADTFFIGRTNDPYKVAATSMAYVLFFMLNALANLFGIGGGSLISRLLRSEGHGNKASFGLSMGGILNILLDLLFMFVIFPEGQEVTGAAVATMLSNVAAIGIVKKVEMLPHNVGTGLCQGMIPLIAYNYSSGNYKRMNKTINTARTYGLLFTFLCILVFEVFAGWIAWLFIKDADTVSLISSLGISEFLTACPTLSSEKYCQMCL